MIASHDKSPGPVRRPAGKRRLFWPVVGAIAVVAVAIWVFAGVFLFALHIAEYVALALVAGWVGYRIGHALGRRARP
jgi:hypothetical protein